MARTGAKYWLPHAGYVWVAGRLQREPRSPEDSAEFVVGAEDGEVITVPAAKFQDLRMVREDEEAGMDDICSVSEVSAASLLNSIRVRYGRNQIYTRVGRVLVSMNPFVALPIYSAQDVQRYASCAEPVDLPPHIFSIGQSALVDMRKTSRSQAILIGGESGSGKTESAKLIISFVADANGGGDAAIVERLLHTHPVLEAFGNALTVRNNNSSRFGKWLDIRLSNSHKILGCSLTSYLLETVRVCSQARDERGFHVFFQLLDARHTHPELKALDLREPKHYRYLRDGVQVAPGIDDSQCFEELLEALTSLGLEKERQVDIFKMAAGILELGNCDFKENDDGSELEDPEVVERVAKLLVIPPKELVRLLVHRRLHVGSSVTDVRLRPAQARQTRDGLARLFYGRLFGWLLSHMNAVLASMEPRRTSVGTHWDPREGVLGVLDIAGFESFEHNSLEQLMINLSNEQLQQHFNRVLFKDELEDSAREGLRAPLTATSFVDNADVLALIDGRAGILDLLDETMAVPKATDALIVQKITKQHKEHPRLRASKFAGTRFGIQHFAGDVQYCCEGWLEKNGDKAPDSVSELFCASGLKVLRQIGEAMADEQGLSSLGAGLTNGAGGGGNRGRGRRVRSVTAGFRMSLRQLMEKVTPANPHFVRCVKPNKDKVAGRFAAPMVMEQLVLSGMLATVQIRQQGYAHRMPHEDFVRAYRMLVRGQCGGGEVGEEGKPQQAIVQEILGRYISTRAEELGRPVEEFAAQFQVGLTKVFMKTELFQLLERDQSQTLAARTEFIQRIFRGSLARRRVASRMMVSVELRTLLIANSLGGSEIGGGGGRRARHTTWSEEPVFEQIGSSMEALQRLVDGLAAVLSRADEMRFVNWRVVESSRVHRRALLELECMQEAATVASSIDTVAIEKVVARAKALRLPSSAVGDLESRLRNLHNQLPVVRALQSALAEAAEDEEDEMSVPALNKVLSVAEDMGLVQHPERWIPELDGPAQVQAAQGMIARIEARIKEEEEAMEREEAQARAAAEAAAAEAAAAAADKLAAEKAAMLAAASPPGSGDGICTRGHGRRVSIADAASVSATSGAGSILRRASSRATVSSLTMTSTTSGLCRALSGSLTTERTQFLCSLRRAADDYDAPALERLLATAGEMGLMETEPCAADSDDELAMQRRHEQHVVLDARETFQRMQDPEFILDSLSEAREAVTRPNAPLAVLSRLDHLTEQLRTFPGYESEVAEAQQALQLGLARRGVGVVDGEDAAGVFATQNAEELSLALKTFEPLSSFSRLKAASNWRGHRGSVALTLPQVPATKSKSSKPSRMARAGFKKTSMAQGINMLQHSKVCIVEALTHLPEGMSSEEFEAAAVLNFRNLLVCTGDRPAQQCQREASRQAVVQFAKSHPRLREEAYLQVLKQLIGNSGRSSHVVWDVLQSLCSCAPPDAELKAFVHAFLTNEGQQWAQGDAAGMPKACLLALEKPTPAEPSAPAAGASRGSSAGDAAPCSSAPGSAARQVPEAQLDVSLAAKAADRVEAASNGVLSELARLQAEVQRLEAEKKQQADELERVLAEARRLQAADEERDAELQRLREELAGPRLASAADGAAASSSAAGHEREAKAAAVATRVEAAASSVLGELSDLRAEVSRLRSASLEGRSAQGCGLDEASGTQLAIRMEAAANILLSELSSVRAEAAGLRTAVKEKDAEAEHLREELAEALRAGGNACGKEAELVHVAAGETVESLRRLSSTADSNGDASSSRRLAKKSVAALSELLLGSSAGAKGISGALGGEDSRSAEENEEALRLATKIAKVIEDLDAVVTRVTSENARQATELARLRPLQAATFEQGASV